MRRGSRRLGALMAVGLSLALCTGVLAVEAPQRDPSMLLEGRAAARRALRWLARQQEENGSWQDDPAVTGLVVTGMVRSGLQEYDPRSEPVTAALDYIRRFARPDGGIYERYYATYTTGICAVALAEAGLPEDEGRLHRALNYLLHAQADEGHGFLPDEPDYGGWGYERAAVDDAMRRPDMSNSQFALEAIHVLERALVEDPEEDDLYHVEDAYEKALRFLGRNQNLREVNDQPWASDTGGFVYRPGESFAGATPEGGLHSYGSQTFAGLKSMLYAGLTREDRRVQAAYDWIRTNWTVEEHPPLGQDGLFHYYLMVARALNVYGAEYFVDAEGRRRDWRKELVDRLLRIQKGNGSWINEESGRWMEAVPELTTAYAVLTMQEALQGW